MGSITKTVCTLFVIIMTIHIKQGQGKRFGCPFRKNEYSLRADTIFHGVFGDSVPPYQYDSMDALNKDITIISDTIELAFKKSILHSNVEELIRFHEAYTKRPRSFYNTTLEQVFDQYHPKFRQYTDLAFIVDIFDRLATVENRTNSERSSYIVTADMSLKVNEIDAILNVNNFNPAYLKHDHNAGILKIQVNNRLGYFIIDPFITQTRIGVVMSDSQPLPRLHDMGKPGQYFMMGQHFVFTSLPKTTINILYYVAQPFCSMLDCTIKTNLLDLSGYVGKHIVNGFVIAQLQFQFKANETPAITLDGVAKHLQAKIYLSEYETIQDAIERDEHTASVYKYISSLVKSRVAPPKMFQYWKMGLDRDFINDVTQLRNRLNQIRMELFFGNGGGGAAPSDGAGLSGGGAASSDGAGPSSSKQLIDNLSLEELDMLDMLMEPIEGPGDYTDVHDY